jgi:signal peptidase II
VAFTHNIKSKRFWPVLLAVLLLDCSTKRIAVETLSPPDVPHNVLGDFLRLTLAYNKGAATGIVIGAESRWLLSAAAVVVIAILWNAYRRTAPQDTARLIALALLTGGAIGNVIDRVRGPAGVVDFIDFGLGPVRFWTFNVADVAVTTGALLLAYVLQHRPEGVVEIERERPGAAAKSSGDVESHEIE